MAAAAARAEPPTGLYRGAFGGGGGGRGGGGGGGGRLSTMPSGGSTPA